MEDKKLISSAFHVFMAEGSGHAQAWMEMVHKLGAASVLDSKTAELAYIAVLASARMDSGMPFHVQRAKTLGATREEVISAVLTGLPAVGHAVIQSLPAALQAYDGE